MRRVLSVVAIALLSFETAMAADIPVKALRYTAPSFNWTGLYVGASGGYGAGQLHGGLGSLTVGINLQTNLPLVFAVESDITFGDLTKNSDCSASACSFQNRWIETTRGRVGYMVDRTLLFATAGFAVGEVNGSGIAGSATSTKFGYVIGGGVEYDLARNWGLRNWSLRGDYLHIDLGKFTCATCGTNPVSFRASTDTFKIGIVYRFFQEEITELLSAKGVQYVTSPSINGPPIEPPPFER